MAAKFSIGQSVKVQPTRQSQPIFITIEKVWFVDSLNEYAYMGGNTTAWEREIQATA